MENKNLLENSSKTEELILQKYGLDKEKAVEFTKNLSESPDRK